MRWSRDEYGRRGRAWQAWLGAQGRAGTGRVRLGAVRLGRCGMTLTDHLNDIRLKRGTLTPEVVVEEATDPAHPLHHRFDWDDTEAAHKWRLTQAGQLLRVTQKPTEGHPNELRSFVALKGTETPRSEYVPISEAMSDPFTRELVLRQMRREWLAFKARYEHISEFAALLTEAAS